MLRGFDLNGDPTSAPIVVASGVRVDMVARPAGGLLFALHDSDSSALEVWSSAGELVESADVSSMGDALDRPVVMAHPDGTVVFGGDVVSNERESILQARDDDGVLWERRGDYDFVRALDGDGSGVTLALLGANPFDEGYDVFVAAYDPLGELLWSVPAGSVSGVFKTSLPSYDFAAQGEGAVTLGALIGVDTETRQGTRDLVVSRYSNDRRPRLRRHGVVLRWTRDPRPGPAHRRHPARRRGHRGPRRVGDVQRGLRRIALVGCQFDRQALSKGAAPHRLKRLAVPRRRRNGAPSNSRLPVQSQSEARQFGGRATFGW